jgi:hypothetical protein
MSGPEQTELSQRIEDVERGYEYLLAFAAQGRTDEAGSDTRKFLAQMNGALQGLAPMAAAAVRARAPGGEVEPFLQALERDADAARAAIALVQARSSISSMLVDNLNASVHLRALLTDLFLVEQWLRP